MATGSSDTQRVKDKITQTLKAMAAIYSGNQHKQDGKNNSWSDGNNSAGLINTCEGLESFLIPSLRINELRDKLLSGQLLPFEVIKESVKEITSRDHLYGDPYIDFRIRGESGSIASGLQNDLEFVDAGGFVASTLLDIRQLQQIKPDLFTDEAVADIDRQCVKALTLLHGCHCGNNRGWGYTNASEETERIDFLYCTWTAVEGITPAFEDKNRMPFLQDTKELLGTLRRDLNSARVWMENEFLGLSVAPGSQDLNLQQEVVDFGGGDSSLYYNLYGITILLLAESQKSTEISRGIDFILNAVSDRRTLRMITDPEGFRFTLDGILFEKHQGRYSDRCFVPMLVKALVLHASRRPEDQNGIMPILREWERKLDAYRNDVLPDVWDNTGRGYSIFYTQRVIECLTYLWSFYNEIEKPPDREKVVDQLLDLIVDDVQSKVNVRIDELESRLIAEERDLLGIRENVSKLLDFLKKSVEGGTLDKADYEKLEEQLRVSMGTEARRQKRTKE